ncbi:MAG: helix-turn-helix domain-containing protein [Phascolarctobacterium sp.]|nr:helix-turn-helix domain-containing protein [Candidatus Phascolarctobacterium caballi]
MQRLKFLRNQLGLTQADLAKMLNITQGALNHYERGLTEPPIEKMQQMAQILHTTIDFLTGRTNKMLYPVLGSIAAGEPLLAEGNIVDYQEFDFEPSLDKEYMVLNVHGNSMYPFYLEGDRVLVELGNCEVEKNRVYAVRVGNQATMKMVDCKTDGMVLVAYNMDVFPPKFYNEQECRDLPVTIIGTVKALSRKID